MLTIRRVSYAALLIGFAQVVFGAIVRISGSGLGCGDHWPDCYGSFTPSSNAQSLLVEISHRYGAAALSIAIVVLALVALRQRNVGGVAGRGGALRPALLAVLLVVVAALFGAVTVKMELNPFVVVTHLAIAMSLLAVLVVVVVRAGGFGATRIPARYSRTLRSARAAVGLTFLALVFGAAVIWPRGLVGGTDFFALAMSAAAFVVLYRLKADVLWVVLAGGAVGLGRVLLTAP